jgi:hypothetical protein
VNYEQKRRFARQQPELRRKIAYSIQYQNENIPEQEKPKEPSEPVTEPPSDGNEQVAQRPRTRARF